MQQSGSNILLKESAIKRVSIKFDNPAAFDIDMDLFDTTTTTKFDTRITVSGSFNYNQFIQDILENPKEVLRMTAIFEAAAQINTPFTIIHHDATGVQYQQSFNPQDFLPVNQYQGKMIDIDFRNREFILGSTSYISQYTLPSGKFLKLMLYVRELRRIDLLLTRPLYRENLAQVPDVVSSVSPNEVSNEEFSAGNARPVRIISSYQELYINKAKNEQ